MANTVIALKNSATPSAVPASLANGELAINYADGKLFYKNTAGFVVELSSAAGGNFFGTVNANSTLIVADTSGDVLTIEAGSGIAIVGDAINDKITISATGGSGSQSNNFTSNVVIAVTDNTNAALRITQTGTGHALLVEDSANPDFSPFAITANGRVIIGANTSYTGAWGDSQMVQIHFQKSEQGYGVGVDDDQSYGLQLAGWSPAQLGAEIYFTHSTGNVVGEHVAVTQNSFLMGIYAYGSDGTAFQEGSAIYTAVDGPVTSGSVPGALLFYTTNPGATYGTERLRITANGRVGIGTISPQYKLEVNGSFAAQTKSFVISHPTKDGKFLRYGSLEGPENGVYVRGKIEGKSIIELPEYWWNLIDEETITVNLTPYGRAQEIWVQSTSSHFIHLNQPADCFFTVFAERKDVDKLIVEY